MTYSTIALSERLAFTTVRITSHYAEGTEGVGTAFFMELKSTDKSCIPVLVTNKHVVDNAIEGNFLFHIADHNNNPVSGENFTITVGGFQKKWIYHPDNGVDLCVMPIKWLMDQAHKMGNRFYVLTVDKPSIPSDLEILGLAALEDVVMIGYPIGLWDSKNNMPIIRRGITATHPGIDYEGRKEFIIDMACFPGSSGSPIFLYNMGNYPAKDGGLILGSRIKLLGVLYGGPQFTAEGEINVVNIPTKNVPIIHSYIPVNLGYCIKACRLYDFEPLLNNDYSVNKDA